MLGKLNFTYKRSEIINVLMVEEWVWTKNIAILQGTKVSNRLDFIASSNL